jgi:hypothetical protein
MVTTGKKSYAVLKFEDGQVVVVQAESSFHVQAYNYQPKQPEQNTAAFAMVKGGMRFVTGLIGQGNKKAFSVSSPNMTIGIRGTDFAVVQTSSGTYTNVTTGGVNLSNAGGTLNVGANQFALTQSATTLPTLTTAAAVPSGTFTQLRSIPAPSATPSSPPNSSGLSSSSGSTTSTSTASTSTASTATTGTVGSAGTTAGVTTAGVTGAGSVAAGGAGATAGTTTGLAGGIATGGAGVATTATGVAAGLTTSSIAIGAGVAAGLGVVANIVTTPRH